MKPGDIVTVRPMERHPSWKHLGPPQHALHTHEPFKATIVKMQGEMATLRLEDGQQFNMHVSILFPEVPDAPR